MSSELHILAFGAHPDDVELGCSGSLALAVKAGKRVGIVDLTKGELGTRGTAETRLLEAKEGARIIGADFRENLGLADGFFESDEMSLKAVIGAIRRHRPKIVLCNALADRHPDHSRAAALVSRACFLSGLRKIITSDGLPEWRPATVLHYIQDNFMEPQVVIDISEHWATKSAAIAAFKSQFFDPESTEPESPISSKAFLQIQEGRAQMFGRYAGYAFGEGFIANRPLGVASLSLLQ